MHVVHVHVFGFGLLKANCEGAGTTFIESFRTFRPECFLRVGSGPDELLPPCLAFTRGIGPMFLKLMFNSPIQQEAGRSRKQSRSNSRVSSFHQQVKTTPSETYTRPQTTTSPTARRSCSCSTSTLITLFVQRPAPASSKHADQQDVLRRRRRRGWFEHSCRLGRCL